MTLINKYWIMTLYDLSQEIRDWHVRYWIEQDIPEKIYRDRMDTMLDDLVIRLYRQENNIITKEIENLEKIQEKIKQTIKNE